LIFQHTEPLDLINDFIVVQITPPRLTVYRIIGKSSRDFEGESANAI
jgi:hypothetical protein